MFKAIGVSIFRDWSLYAVKHYLIGAVVMGLIILLVHVFEEAFIISYRYPVSMSMFSPEQTLGQLQDCRSMRYSGDER